MVTTNRPLVSLTTRRGLSTVGRCPLFLFIFRRNYLCLTFVVVVVNEATTTRTSVIHNRTT